MRGYDAHFSSRLSSDKILAEAVNQRDQLFNQFRHMERLEFDELDEKKIEESWLTIQRLQHSPRCVVQDLIKRIAGRGIGGGNHFQKGVSFQKHRRKDGLLTRKVVVQPAERQPSAMSDL